MLIRNLQFFEQVDNESEIQGGASAFTRAVTAAGPGLGFGDADARARGDFRSFTRTTTGATASPDTGSGVAGAAASGVDRDGSIAASVAGSVSGFS